MPEGRFSIALAMVHPPRAWRQVTQALADRADAQARGAGLTVEILPRGVCRYRDPRLDQLAAATQAAPVTAVPTAAGWSAPVIVETGWSP